MGRKQDRFWKYVVKLEKGRFKCNFCMHDYSGGISRIKSHLSGVGGGGIKICKRAPKDVQRAAYKEIQGASRKRKAPSSSSSDGESDAVADSSPEQDNVTGSQPIDGLENDIDHRIEQQVLGDMTAEERRETGMENVSGESMHTHQRHRGKAINRREDAFWQYAEKLENGRFKCNFCQSVYAGGASRIKSHLSKVQGRGIKICKRVPKDVERHAYEEIRGAANKKIKSMSSPANDMDATANSTLEQDNGAENRVGDVERQHIVVPSMQQDLGTEENHVGNVTGIGENGNGDYEEPRPPTETRTDAEDMMQLLAASSASWSFTESRINDKVNSFEEVLHADESSAFAEAIERQTNEVNSSINDTLNSAQLVVAEGSKQSTGQKTRADDTSVRVGNLWENMNEALMQSVDMGVSAVGHDALNCNEDLNITADLLLPIPNDRLAPDRQMSAMEDTQRMNTDQFVMQPFEIGKDAISEDGGNSVGNMNRPMTSQFDGAVMDVDRENDMEQVIQPFGTVTTLDEPEPSAHQKTSGDAIPTTNLIGETFQINMQNIWDCLMKADVFTIAIYGMGGVGKTSLAIHINNRLLETSNPFRFVYWVTVSQDFSIYRLQTLVAEAAIDLSDEDYQRKSAAKIDFSDEHDQRKRSAKLYKRLTGQRNSVLILDDLWESFDPNEVGIPVGEHGWKLILTSRSLEVCRQMNSNVIKVVPLSTNEGQNLFRETLGSGVDLPSEITQVAKGIVKECAGLPLALKTMAGTMKGVDDICEWRNAFEALKESEAVEGDMEDKVFRILRFSYNRLSSKLQGCFQSCALFPEDHHIERIELIEHLIAEGIIEGGRSMKVKRDDGHALLNKLEYACLLEGSDFRKEKYVKMHDLVRDMAVQILRAKSKSMVEAGKQLRELPDEENWKEGLVRVSLMHNNIEEIPSGPSPNCPNLSTLLLCHNRNLKLISESFFEKLNGLQILDLSYTDIVELPDSVSQLVNLTSLLLKGCKRTKRVPSLAKLTALKKLDLSETGIEDIPHGMELLSNLLSFDLHQTYRMKVFPSGILSRFSKLQYLDLGMTSKKVKAREVARLKKLEFVRGRFSDLHDWNKYIQSFETLCTYCFYLAPEGFPGRRMENEALPRENDVIIEKLENKARVGFVALPKDVHLLLISKCHELKSLHPAFDFSLCHPTQLKRLWIRYCKGMEWLHGILPKSLEELDIFKLDNLCSLLSEGDVAQLDPPFLSIGNDSSINNAIFSNLKSFRIALCPRMKTLFPLQLLPNFHNLERLDVSGCRNMVEIIGNGPESSICSSPTPTPVDFALPKLKLLSLCILPALQSIYTGGGNLNCKSLQEIIVKRCEKLKRMPISLPFLELNGKISPPSSLQKIRVESRTWWHSVDWGHRNEKAALRPLVTFR